MTFSDMHLAGEAVAAFVDGELAPAAHARALVHLDGCAECRRAVREQQEVARLLACDPDPAPPAALIARLRDIPMTTDLGGSDLVLAVEGGDLVWGRASSLGITAGLAAQVAAPRPVRHAHALGRPTPTRPQPATDRPGGPSSGPVLRPRRVGRVLFCAVAGLALGVFAATAPTTTSGASIGPDYRPGSGVPSGGIVDPPLFGEMVGVRGLLGTGFGGDDQVGLVRFSSGDGATTQLRSLSAPGGIQGALWSDTLPTRLGPAFHGSGMR